MPKGPTFKLGKRNLKKSTTNSLIAPAITCLCRVSKQSTARTGILQSPLSTVKFPNIVMSQPSNRVAEGALICNVTVKERGGGRRIIQTRNGITGSLFAFSFPTALTPVFLSRCHSSRSNPLSQNALNASSSRLELRINLSPRGKEFSLVFFIYCLQFPELKPGAT